MEIYTLDTETQGKISVEELASLIFKILKRNLPATKGIVSYSPSSLSSIKAFELLRGPGGREEKIHPGFEKKFAQAVQILRDKGLIMQDHTQSHSAEFVELTDKGEKTEPEQIFPLVGSSDELISKIESTAGPLDRVAKIYLKEAMDTFKSDFLISSAFCLGAMSERCVLQLAKEIEADLSNPEVSRDYSRCGSVKHYANFIADNLNRLRSKYPGNDALFRDLDTKINTLANYYRLTRNEAGHPDFVPNIDRPELELALKTVPKYLETILRVMKLLVT
jgi:uncharacterized protein YktB (UPF0637 family)